MWRQAGTSAFKIHGSEITFSISMPSDWIQVCEIDSIFVNVRFGGANGREPGWIRGAGARGDRTRPRPAGAASPRICVRLKSVPVPYLRGTKRRGETGPAVAIGATAGPISKRLVRKRQGEPTSIWCLSPF